MTLGLLVVGVLLLNGSGRAQPTSAMRDVARGEQSNIESARQAVSRTAAQFNTVWKDHDWDKPAPAVDFAKEMVVSVFLGTQQSAGVSVRIVDVAARPGGGVVVRYRVTRPGASQVSAQVLTFPFHIVAVPAQDGPYTFEQVP